MLPLPVFLFAKPQVAKTSLNKELPPFSKKHKIHQYVIEEKLLQLRKLAK